MSKEAFIFEVSQQSFEKYVLNNSYKIPALVAFIDMSSPHCISMTDLFSDLAREFAEQFIFAKVDVNEQAELCEQYKIENVPTLIVFQNAKPVRVEMGQLEEKEARSLLKDLGVFDAINALRDQAREKHLSGDTSAAILLLTEAIKSNPGNTKIAMDMVQIFLDIGELASAQGLYSKIPESDKQTDMGKALSGQLFFVDLASKTAGLDTLSQQVLKEENNFDARFDLAICQVARYEYEDALNNLFYILDKDENYKDGADKEMAIIIINMLASSDAELAQSFRRKLSNVLSS